MKMENNKCYMGSKEMSPAEMNCTGEPVANGAHFTSNYKNCCSAKTVDLSIKDQYMNNRTECFCYNFIAAVLPSINSNTSYNIVKLLKISSRNLHPPNTLENNLYLDNSALLI